MAPGLKTFLGSVRAGIDNVRKEAAKKGVGFVSEGGTAQKPEDIIVNINEQELARETEALEELLGTLDGQLSLKNATVLIDA